MNSTRLVFVRQTQHRNNLTDSIKIDKNPTNPTNQQIQLDFRIYIFAASAVVLIVIFGFILISIIFIIRRQRKANAESAENAVAAVDRQENERIAIASKYAQNRYKKRWKIDEKCLTIDRDTIIGKGFECTCLQR